MPICPRCKEDINGLDCETIEKSYYTTIWTKDGIWSDYSANSEILMQIFRCPKCKTVLATTDEEAEQILKP